MNKEIKEILDFKENADYKKLSCDEIVILNNYIDNLQRNNWGNLVKATNQKNKIKELEKRITKLKVYKQRIEKAIKYIKNECMYNYGLDDTYMDILLNILRGDKE